MQRCPRRVMFGLCVVALIIPDRAPSPRFCAFGKAAGDRQDAPNPESKGGETVPLPAESVQFVRGIVLSLLPGTFEASDGWGHETRIQSGLNIELDHGRLRTSRRWKTLNHGSWKEAAGQLMVWSISAEADLDVSLDAVVEVRQALVCSEGRTSLRLVPIVRTASATIDRYRLRRISAASGPAVSEFGSWFETLLRRRLKKESEDLPARINRALIRQADRLEIPIWFGSR